MNILYCGDKNILDGMLLSVLSLTERVKEPLCIYLLTAKVQTEARSFEPMPDDFVYFLDKLVKEHHPDGFVIKFNISNYFAAQPPTANMNTRFTPCCMLRLYADLVPELPDKILYLDNDVLCRLDPGVFYRQPFGGAAIAGSLDHYGSWFFRKPFFRRNYLNSGVLLLDLGSIRRSGLFAQCRQMCQEKKMFMPDQSAINKLAEKKLICHRKFNEQRKLHFDTVFQHFTTSFRFFPWFHTVSVKPWNIEKMHDTLHLHEYDALLQRYLILKETYQTEKEPTP